MYKEYFSKEELSYLKASECRNIQEQEEELVITLVLSMVMSFVMFILLVALVLWFNKITIFLCIIAVVPTVILWLVYRKDFEKYKQLVNKCKERINSQEKQTLL